MGYMQNYNDRQGGFNNSRGGDNFRGGFDRSNSDEGKVDPPVRCAHINEDGSRCENMIDWLPFQLTKERNAEGEPVSMNRDGVEEVRAVYCRDHVREHRPPRRDFGGGDRGGFRPRYNN